MATPSVAAGGPCSTFDPQHNPFPPIFPIAGHPFEKDKVDIYPIPLFGDSMHSVKSFMVEFALADAKEKGHLDGVHTLCEATSGNTGCSLGIVARRHGIRRVVAIVERDIAPGKLEQLRLAGVEFEHPDEGMSTIQTARARGKREGWYNFGQYSNDANWRAHAAHTGPHIWRATSGRIKLLSMSLGTTGTLVGASKFLRAQLPWHGVIIGAVCAPDNPVPGVRTRERLKEITFDWLSAADEIVPVERYPAYQKSLRLFQAGRNYGPASGLALAALESVILRKKEAGKLDEMRDLEGRIVAGFVCGDSALPYMDKYSTILDGDEFNPARDR